MSEGLKVIHYLNQFFGCQGGEDKAYTSPQVKEGPIGPGRGLQDALATRGKIVATVVCGDNYFAEEIEGAAEEITQLIKPYEADIVIAGPAFDAGRYGIACGALCKAVQDRLNIPAVTGMYRENPGVDLYRRDIYIVETEDSIRGMTEALSKMVNIGCKLVSRRKIGKPAEEGYFPRGFITNEPVEKTAAERVVSLLLTKLQGLPFESEVLLPKYDRVNPALALKNLTSAKIALVTDGGLVPKGNPDKIQARRATKFGSYDIRGLSILRPGEYEVSHIGYDSAFIIQDPHRLVPLDIMRDLKIEGFIGELHETYYSTSGGVSSFETAKNMGRAIASQLLYDGVAGAILTST
jgi:betaine reductase